jgi:hypothetical protein
MTPPTPLPRESAKAFHAFTIYLEQGQKRSRARVGKTLGVSRQNIDKWADRFHWSERVKAALIADTERAARADEIAKLNVAEERERLALRHTEQKLRAAERLFKRAHEVLRSSTKGTRPHDSARMFVVAALLGDQALGVSGSDFGLRPTFQPVVHVTLHRDAMSDEAQRHQEEFFAKHPELIRPKNGLLENNGTTA